MRLMAAMSATEIEKPSVASSPVLALAEQLRDGPLQELIDLQIRAHELTLQMAAKPGQHLSELAELVRISLAAMQHFHGFTREFQDLLRDLRDGSSASH